MGGNGRMQTLMQEERRDFETFANALFSSLPRSDQRSAAETYTRGLLCAGGRKSIQRLASQMGGPHSAQSLQQFVNQSQWDPQPVRRETANLVTAGETPAAWLVEEVAFARAGRWSAGVDRHYIPSLQRTVNSQLGVSILVQTGDVAVPVNWRLRLPRSWQDDHARRAKAHVPPGERHMPFEQHLLAMVDDMTLEWGTPVAPLVADFTGHSGAGKFLHELGRRDLEYMVKVDGGQLVFPALRTVREGSQSRPVPVSQMVTAAESLDRQTVTWWDGEETRNLRSQFLSLPAGLAEAGNCQVLAEWPLGKHRPRSFWLTNTAGRIQDQVVLAKSRWRARHAMKELGDRYGLFDYEGRSFVGWHHHVTLASCAYAFGTGVLTGTGTSVPA